MRRHCDQGNLQKILHTNHRRPHSQVGKHRTDSMVFVCFLFCYLFCLTSFLILSVCFDFVVVVYFERGSEGDREYKVGSREVERSGRSRRRAEYNQTIFHEKHLNKFVFSVSRNSEIFLKKV